MPSDTIEHAPDDRDAHPVGPDDRAGAPDAAHRLPVHVSALEHYSYCPRQCALIHVEQTFDENLYTLRGRLLHERVHDPTAEAQAGVRIERGLPLWSERLGLVGKADVVEFHGDAPYPVEYKHGPKRQFAHAALQLCAQAMCLEEMTGLPVPRGAIFHHASRRRTEVCFDASLRARVEQTVAEVRRLLESQALPPPLNDARCDKCSLKDSCLPAAVAGDNQVAAARRALFHPHEPRNGAP